VTASPRLRTRGSHSHRRIGAGARWPRDAPGERHHALDRRNADAHGPTDVAGPGGPFHDHRL